MVVAGRPLGAACLPASLLAGWHMPGPRSAVAYLRCAGVYAVVCATAMLGATFRSSISLVVIVVEGTRGIGEGLPAPLGCLGPAMPPRPAGFMLAPRSGQQEVRGRLAVRAPSSCLHLPGHTVP